MFDKLFDRIDNINEDGENWKQRLSSEVAEDIISRVKEIASGKGIFDLGSELYDVRNQINSLLTKQEEKWAAEL